MKTPQQAATKYGANGGSPAAATLWSADFLTAFPTMIANAVKQVNFWQAQVSTAAAAAAFTKGLQAASQNQAAIAAKVNGPAQASFMAGVKAASTGKYLTFANEFLPAVANEVNTLNQTNPRGTPAQNRARLNAYLDWLEAQKGNYKQ
jgi:GH25 family lysozyme M1 (1,4-beta-N-acetylmuramidase)